MNPQDGPDSWTSASPLGVPAVDAGPVGEVPSLSRRQLRIERWLGLGDSPPGTPGWPDLASTLLGVELETSRVELLWRGSGLGRPGAIARFTWPRLSTRVGLGLDVPLAHAVVDHLLGYERPPSQGRLLITPVEWGILSFVIARALGRLDQSPGPFGRWDLELDRVGPYPFDPTGLEPIVTIRVWYRIRQAVGSARLWLPESLLSTGLDAEASGTFTPPDLGSFAGLMSEWRAEAGSIAMPQGLSELYPGSLLMIDGSPLSGTAASPDGLIALVQDEQAARSSFRARAEPGSNGSRLILESHRRRSPRPRETLAMVTPAPSTADLPVTLVVELGRVNLPLSTLAALRPGDVVELGRHSRQAVELTSGGRLVARGELVQVDTELGVRVTQVFL